MPDFRTLLKHDSDAILEEFIDKYTACVNTYDDQRVLTMVGFYQNILKAFVDLNQKKVLKLFEELAAFKISLNIPYIIMINEVFGLQNILISKIANHHMGSDVLDLLSTFKEIGNQIAFVYLQEYIKKLFSVNNVRINSLSDLVKKNLIIHYESHLLWLSGLAQSIQEQNKENFPQLDDTLCDFGIWLYKDAKQLIQNNSKYKTIETLHNNLHLFATKIYANIDSAEYHVLITYLEKCEMLSLSIGTELALIDNILMNKEITKDSLTGALNRQALRNVFENQYELSLATNNSFILAMCDLDLFKDVNDNHGHIAGDRMLTLFVDVVKKNIRTSDIIVRYGGEEFVIILPAIARKKGFEILENIRKEFQNTILEFEGKKIQTTVSIGMMGIKPEHSYHHTFVDEYIMIADQKLYMAKENGRNRIEIY